MDYKSLEESGLGIARSEVVALFAPFVQRSVPEDDPEWRRMLAVRKRRIIQKYARRLLLGWLPRFQRGVDQVIEEYSKVWQGIDYASYDPKRRPPRYSPWEWGEEKLLASTIGATRFRQLLLVRLIETLKPRSVLEVGCGNGTNLLLLAGRFPDVSFSGVELTPAGNRLACAFQEQESLPEHLVDFAPLPLADRSAFKRIDFRQGNAADLPFETNSFDLVYSVLALEQMERIRERALSELARVTRRNAFNIEPFRDVNADGWERLNVLRRGYFQGNIDDLPSYGLQPVMACHDFPQERFLKACAVLSEKRGGIN
jgi:SAM-dependent methyltransferase